MMATDAAAIYLKVMSSDRPEEFGTRLKKIFADRPEMKRAQLADRAGIDASVLSRIEAGKRPATPEVLRWLAGALDMPLGDLVAGTDAEATLATPPRSAENPHFKDAVGTIREQESKVHDLEAQIRTLRNDLDQVREARDEEQRLKESALRSLQREDEEGKAFRRGLRARNAEIARVRVLMADAAAALANLNAKAAALGKGGKGGWMNKPSSATLQFLAEFNAVSGTTFAKVFDYDSLFAAGFDLDEEPELLEPPGVVDMTTIDEAE